MSTLQNPSLIELQNPWWQSGYEMLKSDPHLVAIWNKSYLIKDEILESLDLHPGDIHVLRGPRQVGKTTLLKQKIAQLIQTKHDRQSILYLSCEGFLNFQELQHQLVAWLKDQKDKYGYIFLDEVSFVAEWQRAILFCANLGLLQRHAMLVTGSNARDLKQSSERLPGRRGKGLDLSLHPASPVQLRHLKCFDHLSDDLVQLYFRMGGFPHAIRDYVEFGLVTDETYRTYLNWLIGDAARYDLSVDALKHMLYRIFETFSSRITFSSIIDKTPVKSHETAIRYIDHLDDAFLCQILHCYDPDTHGPAIHKARKIFLIDPLLYYLAEGWKLGGNNFWARSGHLIQESTFVGRILESTIINLVGRQHQPIYFWYSAKAKKEVDLVLVDEQRINLFDVKLGSTQPYQALNQTVQILGKTAVLQGSWA